MSTPRRSSLRDARLSERVFATAMLVTLAIGFGLSLVYLWAREIRPHRERGRRLLESVVYTYHGEPERPRLLAALHGSMASFVAPDELKAIDGWITTGATEDGYASVVAPIFERQCLSCHAEGKYPPTLVGYEQVARLAQVDKGMDLVKLARMTHVHLLGIPLLFFILGTFFVRTRYPEGAKAVLVVVPFIAVLWDISHWWLTRRYPSRAIGVIVGGALMSVGFAVQWAMTLIDVWWPRSDRIDRQEVT